MTYTGAITELIKAVFFDFYNTLGKFHPPREELQAQACGQFGIDVTPHGITIGYSAADAFMAKEVAILPLKDRDRQGVKDFFAEYERLVLDGAGVKVSLDLALRISEKLRQLAYGYALYDDVLPTLGLLKDKELILGLLSNNEADMDKLSRELGLSAYLDFVISSSDVLASKPDPAMFLAGLDNAGVEPQEALHVGDQYISDVKGAQAVGINAVLLDRDGLNKNNKNCVRIERLDQIMELVG